MRKPGVALTFDMLKQECVSAREAAAYLMVVWGIEVSDQTIRLHAKAGRIRFHSVHGDMYLVKRSLDEWAQERLAQRRKVKR